MNRGNQLSSVSAVPPEGNNLQQPWGELQDPGVPRKLAGNCGEAQVREFSRTQNWPKTFSHRPCCQPLRAGFSGSVEVYFRLYRRRILSMRPWVSTMRCCPV